MPIPLKTIVCRDASYFDNDNTYCLELHIIALLITLLATFKAKLKGFLSPKERGRGTGVKEKQITADDSAKAYNYVNEVNTVNDVMDSGSGTTNVTSEDGLDALLEKEDVGNVPVCVKLRGVPMTEFSEDRLSVIATILGTPLMLDSYMSDMCMQSWGWSSFSRAIIELRANVELKDIIVLARFPQLMLPVPPVPLLDGTGLPDGMKPAILNQQPA
ncbi:hypothetical protein Tco_0875272 [Tanacetum coccineum]|uniref:Uncharacterized protein n=1 Tax=Tanacetum coccineum TaxID=301880 RepID=A0ABQ5BP02_9ASTR